MKLLKNKEYKNKKLPKIDMIFSMNKNNRNKR